MKDDSLSDVQMHNSMDYICSICADPKPDPKSIWRCLNCSGRLMACTPIKLVKDSVGKQDKSEALKMAEAEMKSACEDYGKQEPDPLLAKHEPALNVYAKQIWNKALEAAANVSEINSAANIRKLKK